MFAALLMFNCFDKVLCSEHYLYMLLFFISHFVVFVVSWREGVVTENKKDETFSVYFPGTYTI